MIGSLGFIFQHLMSVYPALAVFGLCGMFYSLRPKPTLSVLESESCKIQSKSQKSLLKFLF